MNIILKVDDYRADVADRYDAFLKIIEESGAKASLGFIGQAMEKVIPERIEWLKSRLGVTIEPFNHSYFHLLNDERREFLKTDEEYQHQSIVRTNEIVLEKLGFRMQTIGFVANACDKTTFDVLEKNGDILICYHVAGAYNNKQLKQIGKIVLDVNTDIFIEHNENGGNVLAPRFFDQYFDFWKKSEEPMPWLMIFQMHPASWSAEDLQEFKRIIEFLAAEGHQFVFPSKYLNLKQ